METKKLIALMLALLIILPLSNAEDQEEEKNYVDHEVIMDGLSFWQRTLLNINTLTIEGENAACSKYPDDIRASVIQSVTSTRNPLDFSFKRNLLTEFGRVNIYKIKSDGGWEFIPNPKTNSDTVLYGEKFTFIGGQSYAIEYYNCPAPKMEVPVETPVETCSYKEYSNFVCEGDNLYQEVRQTDCEIDFTKFNKACTYGCSEGACKDKPVIETPVIEDNTPEQPSNPGNNTEVENTTPVQEPNFFQKIWLLILSIFGVST